MKVDDHRSTPLVEWRDICKVRRVIFHIKFHFLEKFTHSYLNLRLYCFACFPYFNSFKKWNQRINVLNFAVKRRMEVLKLEDIEQEYMLVHARLQLLQRDPDSAQIAGNQRFNSEFPCCLIVLTSGSICYGLVYLLALGIACLWSWFRGWFSNKFCIYLIGNYTLFGQSFSRLVKLLIQYFLLKSFPLISNQQRVFAQYWFVTSQSDSTSQYHILNI